MPKNSACGVKSKHRMDPCYERVNNAKRKHQHRGKLQVVNRRKAVKEAASRSSQGSLFEASRNVEIGGGQFSSARGHHANFTINFNQSAMDGGVELDDLYPGSTNDAQTSSVMDNESGSRPIWGLSPLPVQRSCDIYYRHLAVKGRGSPLWLPEPSSTLPNLYRRQGIAVGDVGIITASGGFDFMFNVCLPADHPINQQGLPEGFSPLFPQLQSSDIRRHTEFNPNSHLASASVEKSHRESDFSGIEFTSAASEGAILTMPQGAHAEDLANVSRFRQYLSVNAESWYRYVNHVRGREARNGDVRLVVGCDKASSWGMATFANSTAQDFHLKFKPTGESGSSRTYGWEYSGMVEARAGPDPEETDELRHDDFGRSGVYKNQCLFIRTLNATLRDDVWDGLGFDFETAMDIQYDSYPNSYIPSSGSGSSTRSPSPTGLSPSNSTTTYGSTRSSSTTSLSQESLPSVYIADFNTALTAHPSKTINDFMLTANPHARIAITEDKDWTSLIVESDQRLPPPEELINRMLVKHDVCEADGVVFLQLKQENKSTHNSSTSISADQANHDIIDQAVIFEAGLLEPPSPPLGQTSVEASQLNPGQLFGTNTPRYISPNPLPSPLFLHPILSPPSDFPGNFIQFDLKVDLPSVDPWASPPLVGDFDARRLLDTQMPGLPPSPEEFVPGTLLGSWGGSFLMDSPNTDTETLLSPPVVYDWGAELSNYPPMFPSIPGLEGCISTLNSICRNINDIKANKEQCQALSKRCANLLAILQGDLGIRSCYDSTIPEEIDRVITRLDRKVKEYGSWNQLKTILRQQDIRSELGSLQTDMETIITKISIFHSRNAFSSFAHSPASALAISSDLYAPHAVKRRKRTTRISLTALEEAFVSNPKPNAFLRKQLAKTLDMPERSVQVWFQNRRAKEKSRQRPPHLPEDSSLLDKESVSGDESATSTTGDSPLRLDSSQAQPESQIGSLDSLSCSLHLADVQGIRYADLRNNDFVPMISSKNRTHAKLTDLGFSFFEPLSIPSYGSRSFIAPEIITSATMELLRTDVWAIGALLNVLTPNSHELPGPEQNDPRRSLGSLQEEYPFLDSSRISVSLMKPSAIIPMENPFFPDDSLTHNLECLDDGTSSSKGPGIGEDSLAEGC